MMAELLNLQNWADHLGLLQHEWQEPRLLQKIMGSSWASWLSTGYQQQKKVDGVVGWYFLLKMS